jgi:hypothetical protein
MTDPRVLKYVLLFVFVAVLGELCRDVRWGTAFTLGVCVCAVIWFVVGRVARRSR